MLIEIVKWEKHNPRTNAKQWSWLRLQNDIFDDEDLDDFAGHQFVVWIYALTRRNKANTVAFTINLRHCAKKAGCSQAEVAETLHLLEQRGKIRILEAAPTAPSAPQALPRTPTHADAPTRTQTYADVPERTHEHPTLRDDTDVTLRTDGRRGSEGHSANAAPGPAMVVTVPKRAKAPPGPRTPAGEVWEAYSAAYTARYGHPPVRNAKGNAQCSQLVGRLGADAAVKVVEFYLTHGKGWYVQCVHALGACLQDCEALHTQMLAGHRVTATDARRVDQAQGNAQAFAAAAAELKREGKL